jgi:hypothetical protein
VAFVACKNDADKPAPAPSGSANASASVVASASAAPAGPATYDGTYTATAGTLYVPDAEAWSGVKLRGDDAGALGEGALSITIDPDGGALTGKLEGPLGPATINGVAREGAISFHVAPRETTDLSFSGTGTGAVDGGSVSGEMHLSSWRANVLRDATFQAKKK